MLNSFCVYIPERIIVTLLKRGYSHIYLIMTLTGVMLINGSVYISILSNFPDEYAITKYYSRSVESVLFGMGNFNLPLITHIF